jgi:hypothetical protein
MLSRKLPVAGIKNIVMEGFGVRGQVDLIDFQSMPDGAFKFLLNNIDHGIKKLTTTHSLQNVHYALRMLSSQSSRSKVLQKFFKPTMEVNSHRMPRTTMAN